MSKKQNLTNNKFFAMQEKPKPRAKFPNRREMRQEAGNMYNLVGIAKDALIAAGQREKVDALIDDVFNKSKSYEDAIKISKNTWIFFDMIYRIDKIVLKISC